MLSEPSLQDVLELLRRAPAPPGYEMPVGASEALVDELQERTGHRPPAQLKQWLLEVNGAMVGPGGLFGLRPANDPLSITKYLSIFPNWSKQGWLPIASDGLGNYWVTAVGPDGRDGWVAFIDVHEDPDSLHSYVASSVFSFLNFILKAELGELGWPGDRDYVVALDPTMERVADHLRPWR